ncbi:hypothetical protein SV7mr_09420 [Stieleria bergensis]|uniref:Uncharacterized protein n=1 Tax=Stieleria bergensis TaxID=2528025 RepID=A0A517SQR0_9BACT|nr:hypothetical protein SV7mr_09420 [Planctomycetes bacterium SV_7m_r]
MPLAAILGSFVAKTEDESDSRMSAFLDVGGDLNATYATVTLQFPEFQRTTIRLSTFFGNRQTELLWTPPPAHALHETVSIENNHGEQDGLLLR